jgi:hypothetical protein
VASEPPPTLPAFLVQSASASWLAGAAGGSAAPTNGDESFDEQKVCRSPVSGIMVKYSRCVKYCCAWAKGRT